MRLKFLLSLPLLISASENYFIVDPYFSPYIGGEDILSTHRLFEKVEEWAYMTATPPKTSIWAIGERLMEMVVVWDPLNLYAVGIQHELFGHGYRLRSLGSSKVDIDRYNLHWPPPYGSGGGSVDYTTHPDRLSTIDEAAIAASGVEGTAILANRIKLHWIHNQEINAKTASLYLFSQQDITEYILGMSPSDQQDDGHDIRDYLFWISANVNFKSHLSDRTLKQRSLMTLIDPFSYYAVFSWFYFVFAGKAMPIPMIPLTHSVQFLPNARLGLNPFGPEYFIEGYFRKNQVMPFYIYGKWGSFAGVDTYGFGLEYPDWWQFDRLLLGFRLDVWNQPSMVCEDHNPLFPEKTPSHLFDNHWGGAVYLMGKYLFGNRRGSLYLQLGYKNSGFLPGESLSTSWIPRGGFTFLF